MASWKSARNPWATFIGGGLMSTLWPIIPVLSTLLGCRGTPPPPTPSTALPPLELDALETPPVTPTCGLSPLPHYAEHRRYLTYDLNDDSVPEYFIEDTAGAHSMVFVLVDSTGRPLTRGRDTAEIGGDRLLILESRHHGYRDIICSFCDAVSFEAELWEFNGRHYVRARSRSYKEAQRPDAFIERLPGTTRACWYADMLSRPTYHIEDTARDRVE